MEEESKTNHAPSNSMQLEVVDNGRHGSSLVLVLNDPEIKANGVNDDESESHNLLVFVKKLISTKWMKVLEVGLVSIIILVAWSLLTIPTIFYALPPRIRTVHKKYLMQFCQFCYFQ